MPAEPEWLTKMRAEGRVVEGQTALESLASKLGCENEAEFQKAVIELAHARGWRVAHFRKARIQRTNGDTYWETPVGADGAGWPDLFLCKGKRIIWAELKSNTGRVTSEQKVWLNALLVAGQEAYVWKPRDWEVIIHTLV